MGSPNRSLKTAISDTGVPELKAVLREIDANCVEGREIASALRSNVKAGDKEILKSGEATGPSGLEGVVGGRDLEAQVVNDGPPASPEFSGKRKREESAEATRPHKTAKFEHEVEAVSSLEPVLMPSTASEDASEQQQCQKCGEKLPEDNEEPKAKEDTYRLHCHYGLKSPVCSQCDKDQRSCQICENIIPREELMDGYILINESRVCVEYDEDMPICEGCADELMGARMITVYCENCNEIFQSGGYTNHWGRFDPLERLCEACLDADESSDQGSIESLEYDKVEECKSGQEYASKEGEPEDAAKKSETPGQILESHAKEETSPSNTDELPKCRHCSSTFRLTADEEDDLDKAGPLYSALESPICPKCIGENSKCQNCNQVIPLDELSAGYNYLEENVGLGEADFDEAVPICCDCAYAIGQEQTIDWVCENCGNEFETTGGINNWQQLEPDEGMCEDCREGRWG